MRSVIPQDDATRKAAPMYRGLLGYFPAALFRVAYHSYVSDRKHNADKPESESPHWARGKSTDHADCIVRHLAEMHTDPLYHMTAIAWRALAMLQEYLEGEGAAPGSRSVFTEPAPDVDPTSTPVQDPDGHTVAPKQFKIVDVGEYDSECFAGETFPSRTAAQYAIRGRIDEAFVRDFVVEELS